MDDFLAAKMEDFANPQGAEVEKPTSKPEGFAPPSMDGEKEGEKTLQTALDNAKEGNSEEAVAMTQKVARRIREERQRAKTELIAELFGSEAGLEKFKEEQAARQRADEAQRIADSGAAAELDALYTRLALCAEPNTGPLFCEWQADIDQLAQSEEIGLETAFLFLLRQRLPDILRAERERVEQETVAKIIASSVGPGSLSAPAEEAPAFSGLSDREFELLLAKVKGGQI